MKRFIFCLLLASCGDIGTPPITDTFEVSRTWAYSYCDAPFIDFGARSYFWSIDKAGGRYRLIFDSLSDNSEFAFSYDGGYTFEKYEYYSEDGQVLKIERLVSLEYNDNGFIGEDVERFTFDTICEDVWEVKGVRLYRTGQ